ncbi:MAG: S8 family serine peptidase [Chloroflexi bacterium]|nr:S8 family serine peptidase [Chloroflexota bacterium]
MKVRPVALSVLILLVGFAPVLGFSIFGSSAQGQNCGAADPDVFLALASEAEVPVLISLQAPADATGQLSVSAMQANTAQRQAAVLTDLTASDFTLGYQYTVAPALADVLTASGADILNCHPDVLKVDRDVELFATLAESVPLIRANFVQLLGFDGTDVDVAVLDTGIDTDHPDLIDNIIGEACFTDIHIIPALREPCPDDPAHPNYSPGHPAEDGAGHGTHVSGIITSSGAATGLVGVAPNAGIFAYKVLDDFGFGRPTWILAAVDDILTSDPGEFEFINMSLSDGGSHQPDECGTSETSISPAIATTIEALRDTGTLTFASSGNEGFKSGLGFPACMTAVISVGAVYDGNVGSIPWLTCTDTTTAVDQVACGSNSSAALDLLAPGSKILSTWPVGFGAAFASGTSMASPHALGVAALLKDASPSLTPDDIEACLKSTGFPITDPANSVTTPRINALAALGCLAEPAVGGGAAARTSPARQYARSIPQAAAQA